jgi:cellulose synthase/poly-beta-1,6-N-acetylglucosamine synthase-like glycosyltransferase
MGIQATLDDIKIQMRPGDRMLVVADNCTDDTAVIARAIGAEVTERQDLTKIGKGYALDWGLRYLAPDPPDIVIIIDADCRVANDTLHRLAMACAVTGRPVQALDLMTAVDASPIDHQVAEFAFRVKNWVRPLGLGALNLPCQLMGTGMAFPWGVISSTNLASELAVEDLKLGLDLAQAGHLPLFCPSAAVYSPFPVSTKAAVTQRKRWEQGHLRMIATTVPHLMFESIARGNFGLLALSLDAAIPPLTLLGVLINLMFLVSCFGFLFGLSSSALIISAISLLAYSLAVLLCWLKFGRDILPFSSILSVISYIVGKLPLYQQIFTRESNLQWTRTDRGRNEKGQ